MTQGKLKMYRRDRLYASDKDRLQNLQDCLKNVRIVDETAFFNNLPGESNEGGPSKSDAKSSLPPSGSPNKRGGRGGGGEGPPPSGKGPPGGGDKRDKGGPGGASGG